MKNLIMIYMLSLTMTVSINAQEDINQDLPQMEDSEQKTSKQRMEKKLDKLSNYLNLDDGQKAQVAEVLEADVEKRKALKQKAKEERKAMLQDRDSRMQSILTPEQYIKYQEGKEKMRGKRKDRMKQRRRGGSQRQ